MTNAPAQLSLSEELFAPFPDYSMYSHSPLLPPEQIAIDATKQILQLGMNAFDPIWAEAGVEWLLRFEKILLQTTHVENISVVRWGPTGEAIMLLAKPRECILADKNCLIKEQHGVLLKYEVLKAEDRNTYPVDVYTRAVYWPNRYGSGPYPNTYL